MVPTSNVTLERSSRTEDRATAPQVTAQEAFCLSALAVMVHVPGATQVTSPSETVATSGSLDVHSTVPAQVLGVTVVVRAAYWLPFKYSSLLLSWSLSAFTGLTMTNPRASARLPAWSVTV